MERLTERDEFGNADIIGVDSVDLQLNLTYPQFNRVTEALNRLAAYEEAEEQGLLVRLPCKVGDTVWFWCGDTVFIKDKPFSLHSGVITKLKCVCFANGKMVFLSNIEYDIKDPYHENKTRKSEAMCSFGEYGDWLRFYLTREEAEAALKGESEDV